MSDHKQIIAGLNKALEWEYSATVQYTQHAAQITGAQYESIISELNVHAQEELQHAKTLSEEISFLGGTPSIDVETRDISTDAKTMLEQDLAGEENAIKMYHGLIEQAEAAKLYGLRRKLEDILVQEEEHKRDLDTMLGN